MKKIGILKFVALFCLLFAVKKSYSQGNNLCSNPTPFCTANPMTFPAGVNAGNAQAGPSYGCLGGQPNPAWFFMQMATTGPMSILIQANNDVDFICWGPFASLNGACNNLTSVTQVPVGGGSNGCSFSASNTETCIIANAVAGQFYVLLVTNWSNSVQNINLTQTNGNVPGAGTTNCGIICTVTPVSTGPICPGGTATISATTGTSVNTYTWVGPGGLISTTSLTNVIGGIQTTTTFSLQASTSTGSCQALTTVTVVPLPSYTVSPQTTTVCQNGSYIVTAIAPNPQQYFYQWQGPNGVTFTSPNGAGTLVNTLPLPAQTPTAVVIMTVVVTPTILNCPMATTLSVRINNPPTPTLTIPPPMCSTGTGTFVTASPGGGTWYGCPYVNALGIVSPNQATIFGLVPVCYSIIIGACPASNCASISVSQVNTAALTGTVPNKCVFDGPFNLMSIVSNTQGIWSGVNVSPNNLFYPTYPPTPSTPSIQLPTGTYALTYYNPSTPPLTQCVSTNTIVVAVFNPATPTISTIGAKCSNSPSVALSASPGGGIWSGNPGITGGGIYTPGLSSNLFGTNSVTYTAGQGTCVASSSTTFHVSRFNSAALNTSFLSLCVTTNTVNLMSLVTSTVNGAWTGGGLGFIGTYSFNPAGLPTGTYVSWYNTTSTPPLAICADSTLLSIRLLHPAQPIITPIGPICTADVPFQLSVSPNTGSFVPSLYLTSGGLFTPSLSPVGISQVQYVIGTSTCNATDTKLISVEAFVPATIIGAVPDQCNTNPVVNLLNLTANNLGSWSGPGVLGASFNPAVSGIGAVPLMYSTASWPSGLCPDQQTLAVNVYSLALPVITQAGPYCNSQAPFKLSVSPLGGLFGSNTNGGVDVNGWFNPAAAVIGDNVVNYSVTSGPCVAFTQATIKIEAFVSADFNKYAGPFCKNEPAIDLNSLAQNPGGVWAGPGVSGNIFTPANANIGNTNILIYYTHSLTQDLCPDTSAMRVRVNDVPSVGIVRDVLQGCEPVQVTFNTPNTNTGRGQWFLGDGSDPQDGLTVVHTYTAPGTYSVAFNYWDDIGCGTQTVLTNAVMVFEVPQAAFSYNPYDEISIAEPQVQFMNQTPGLGNNRYSWQIADLYTSTEVNPKALFTKAGQYRITLTATSLDGCQDEVSKILIVNPDFNVFIPNSFTPNFDGLNDVFIPVFSPYGLDSKTFEMEIFDRWGNSLYHTKDITRGWDGTINNKGAEPLKQEVYVYRIRYKDLEGKIYTKLGNVTLLR